MIGLIYRDVFFKATYQILISNRSLSRSRWVLKQWLNHNFLSLLCPWLLPWNLWNKTFFYNICHILIHTCLTLSNYFLIIILLLNILHSLLSLKINFRNLFVTEVCCGVRMLFFFNWIFRYANHLKFTIVVLRRFHTSAYFIVYHIEEILDQNWFSH